MVRYSTLFLVIAIIALLLSLAESAFEGTLSVMVPGWHISSSKLFRWIRGAQVIWLCILPLGYFLLEKSGRIISRRLVFSHLFCTLFAFLTIGVAGGVILNFLNPIVFYAPLLSFMLGQGLFLFGFLKSIKSLA
jgi:hypothetical protein